jgi:mRNA interferase MazF
MKAGDIVLAFLPQADEAAKLRPALVLCQMPPYGDLLLCGISSQLDRAVHGFDEVVRSSDADFRTSGLRVASVVRLGFLATRSVGLVGGVLGRIDSARLGRLLNNLVAHLQKPLEV